MWLIEGLQSLIALYLRKMQQFVVWAQSRLCFHLIEAQFLQDILHVSKIGVIFFQIFLTLNLAQHGFFVGSVNLCGYKNGLV